MDVEEKKKILRFLSDIGVDTRFVSLFGDSVFINNLRFSKFSRSREETFRRHYPRFKVVRSTIFQKICSRASRVLSREIKPGERILVKMGPDPLDYTLYIVLEPYTRKYGVELVTGPRFDLVASPMTLDHIIVDIIDDMVSGRIITGPPKLTRVGRMIYPLSLVPVAWVERWLGERIKVTDDKILLDFIGFFEDILPQFRENMLRAVKYLEEKKS